MTHDHYFTQWVNRPWWAFWRGPTLACKCGIAVDEAIRTARRARGSGA